MSEQLSRQANPEKPPLSFYFADCYRGVLEDEARRLSFGEPSEVTGMSLELSPSFDRDPDIAKVKANKAANKVATRYMEKFPDQLQAIAVISEIGSVIRIQNRLQSRERMGPEELEAAFRDLTEYQFLITNFALQNINDVETMKSMWFALFSVANKNGGAETVAKLKTGVLSTVAAMKCLEAIGAKPTLSRPEDDAFHAIDINLAGDRVVQVKRGYETDSRILFTTDEADFPGVEVQGDDGSVSHGSSGMELDDKTALDLARFRRGVEEYGKSTGRKVVGYFIKIPYHKTEGDTGRPSDELIAQVKQEFADSISRRNAQR